MSKFVDEVIHLMDEQPDSFIFSGDELLIRGGLNGIQVIGRNAWFAPITHILIGGNRPKLTGLDQMRLELAVSRWFSRASIQALSAR
jgi:hypothetical protein